MGQVAQREDRMITSDFWDLILFLFTGPPALITYPLLWWIIWGRKQVDEPLTPEQIQAKQEKEDREYKSPEQKWMEEYERAERAERIKRNSIFRAFED